MCGVVELLLLDVLNREQLKLIFSVPPACHFFSGFSCATVLQPQSTNSLLPTTKFLIFWHAFLQSFPIFPYNIYSNSMQQRPRQKATLMSSRADNAWVKQPHVRTKVYLMRVQETCQNPLHPNVNTSLFILIYQHVLSHGLEP